MKLPKYKLCVSCMTYNHASFITDAMLGFCSQKTAFPYICCIVDDASTDGEQTVICEYLAENFDFSNSSIAKKYETDYAKVIFAQHKTNKNCFFAVLLLKENHYVKKEGYKKLQYLKSWRDECTYEALCEGDDYWINENKLQMQVDFLDKNKDYSVCSHRIKKYDEDSKTFYVDRLDSLFINNKGCNFNNRFKIWISETSSIVYRLEAHSEYKKYPYEKRDVVHLYFLLKYGKGFCLSEVMSVYRQHQGGIFSKQDIDTKLINGGYKALKNLYSFEKTPDARYLYFRNYALTFLLTKGRILFKEPFSFRKFISLPYFILSIVIGIHPIYKKVE